MKKNERLDALNILTKLLQEKTPLSHLMQANKNLTPLTKELCFGVCRHYYRLQAIADRIVTKRPKTIDVWLGLLMGIYQLHYLRIPDYAVVKETVALMQQIKKTWAKGLVNAVLRTFCREQETIFTALKDDPAFCYNHPAWLIQLLRHNWPNDWQAILQGNDAHPPMSLRVNRARSTANEYRVRLQETGIAANNHIYASQGIELVKACDVYELPGFEAGEVSVQDQAAQLAISLLDLKPGIRVLDACCAPGGKTCHILESQPQLETCVALDVDSKRLVRVRENLNRLDLEANLLQGDALHPEAWWDGVPFDRILLDAPCSATGVIRRHPDIKLLRTPADIEAIVAVQKNLLQALWPLLAPGGILVYATCSVMPEENEQQVAQFIATQNNCHFTAKEQPWGRFTGHGWQILPGSENMDGFFYSVLTKTIHDN